MKDKLTEDCLDSYLCDAFAELRPYLKLHHKEMIKEMEQAYQQIKRLIEKKPRVTEEFIGKWEDVWTRTYNYIRRSSSNPYTSKFFTKI